jgi:hypothetical protein
MEFRNIIKRRTNRKYIYSVLILASNTETRNNNRHHQSKNNENREWRHIYFSKHKVWRIWFLLFAWYKLSFQRSRKGHHRIILAESMLCPIFIIQMQHWNIYLILDKISYTLLIVQKMNKWAWLIWVVDAHKTHLVPPYFIQRILDVHCQQSVRNSGATCTKRFDNLLLQRISVF